MTAPVPRPGPDVAGRLAEVLREHQTTRGMRVSMGWTCACGWWSETSHPAAITAHQAAALLPVVDDIAGERAAEELRAVAHRLDDGGDEAIEVALGGAAYVHRVLGDCAHALDGTP